MVMSEPVVPRSPEGRHTRQREAARAGLAAVIWDPTGRRRLPHEDELVTAIAACEPRDVWWTCEASRHGPVYLLPTVEWIELLAVQLEQWQARSILEVAAGDGFLSASLRAARPTWKVVATDNHAWTRASARQSMADRREFRGVAFSGIVPFSVDRMAASPAVAHHQPDVVLCSWAPPGLLVERCIRGPCQRVVDISVEGDVCGNGHKTWRFHKEFLDGPLEDRALCRLDDRTQLRQTRVTAYFGANHPEYGIE
jgi:hypothetical protein